MHPEVMSWANFEPFVMVNELLAVGFHTLLGLPPSPFGEPDDAVGAMSRFGLSSGKGAGAKSRCNSSVLRSISLAYDVVPARPG
mmetsp:Transcript_118247/g.339239  ORF Transcript_118247/g.339239 Transcript_118247/m.339239 type:complete len:84 (-) Transcript_118247:670-921(-)